MQKQNKKKEAASVRAATASVSKNPADQSQAQEGSTLSLASSGGKVETPTPLSGNTAYLPVEKLTPHPLNTTIYGNAVDSEFTEAIRVNGIYDPLLVAPKTKESELQLIISGHRRWEAARTVGIKEVPVVVFGSSDDETIKLALLEANRQRVKTNEQLVREFSVYLEIEEKKAAQRQVTSVAGKGKKNFAKEETGKARDRAAALVGLSGPTAEKGLKVVLEIEKEAARKHHKKAEALRKTLIKSVNSAFKAINKPKDGKEADAPTAPEKTQQPETTPDDAIKGVEVALNFLRGQDKDSLTEEQKATWKKAVEQLVGLAQDVGVEIEVAVAA